MRRQYYRWRTAEFKHKLCTYHRRKLTVGYISLTFRGTQDRYFHWKVVLASAFHWLQFVLSGSMKLLLIYIYETMGRRFIVRLSWPWTGYKKFSEMIFLQNWIWRACLCQKAEIKCLLHDISLRISFVVLSVIHHDTGKTLMIFLKYLIFYRLNRYIKKKKESNIQNKDYCFNFNVRF